MLEEIISEAKRQQKTSNNDSESLQEKVMKSKEEDHDTKMIYEAVDYYIKKYLNKEESDQVKTLKSEKQKLQLQLKNKNDLLDQLEQQIIKNCPNLPKGDLSQNLTKIISKMVEVNNYNKTIYRGKIIYNGVSYASIRIDCF